MNLTACHDDIILANAQRKKNKQNSKLEASWENKWELSLPEHLHPTFILW